MATRTQADVLLELVVGWPLSGEVYDQWQAYLSGHLTLDEFVAELSHDQTIALLAWAEWFPRRLTEVVADHARRQASGESTPDPPDFA